MNDVMHRKRTQRIWGFWIKSVSWVLASGVDGYLSGLAEARPVALRQVSHVVRGRWKSQHRTDAYLSPFVEKHLNSKVIKSFVPELRNRKCFLCFGISMFYVYVLLTFYVHFPYFEWLCYIMFLLTVSRSGLLAKIRWFICISKSQRTLCVIFSGTNSGLRQ